MCKDASWGAWEGIDGWGFGGWGGVWVCHRWGHGVRGPGVPTGYGPGRCIDWDHIMSDVRHLHVLKRVEVPAVPIHLVIEVCNGDVEVLNIGTHDLAWSAV